MFRAKVSTALDKAENPHETLDYSYQRQLELLTKVRRGVADVATSRKRLELQGQKLQQAASKLEDQARKAVAAGREDLAREALTRRAGIETQMNDLKVQHDQLTAEEAKLTDASRRLQTKVDAFRTKKETIKATYTAAEAQAKIGEAFSGISEEMGDIGMAMERAENKTEQLQARAGALDELLESGALDDFAGGGDRIDKELASLSAGSSVELELARMKGELGTGEPTKQLAAGTGGNGAATPAPATESATTAGQGS